MTTTTTTTSVSLPPRNMIVAYALLLFFGYLGAHRFYLGRKGTAITMIALWIVGMLLIATGIGLLVAWIPLGIIGIWCLVDLFLIPGMSDSTALFVQKTTGAE